MLINGEEAFPLILERIQKAKEEIIISMFIWRDDSIGNQLAGAVINAAERGVRVSIIKDKVGSIFEKEEENKKSFFHGKSDIRIYLSQKIMSFMYFRYLDENHKGPKNPKLMQMQNNPRISLDIDKLRYDHSKYYLIDNKYLILGGMNIEDKELSCDKKSRPYIDYMVEIQNENHIEQFREIVVNKKQSRYSAQKIFYINNRDANIFEIKSKVLELIDRAECSIDIEMAYWGDNDVTNKIVEASGKGLDISIIMSKESNLQNDFNMKTMSSILRRANNAVKVYLSPGMVHSKLLCLDKSILFFGSANFNRQGLEKLSELNILIEDNKEAINAWSAAREKHLEECDLILNFRELKYNRLLSFIERIYC